MTTKSFGEPILRKEDPRLVSGQGRYLDDLGHDALAAAFLRSPHASARILDIDVTDALEVPGLIGIYTLFGTLEWTALCAALAFSMPTTGFKISYETLMRSTTSSAT